MSFLEFIKTKTFVKHTAIAAATAMFLLWLGFKYLDMYSHHNETIEVPDFSNIKSSDIETFIKDKNLRYSILDSIYDPSKPKGIVIKQDPAPSSKVKYNRTVYLYVTTIRTPHIKMPRLIDKSLRQAVSILQTTGLKHGKTRFIPDQCTNCVLQQLIKGKRIKEGTEVDAGAVVDLVVGKGVSDEKIAVPNLIGLTRGEVQEKLFEMALSEGAVTYDEKYNKRDSLSAKVYRQSPSADNAEINLGSSIDLYFTAKKEKLPSVADTTKQD